MKAKPVPVTITASDMKALRAVMKKATKLAEKYARANGIKLPKEVTHG